MDHIADQDASSRFIGEEYALSGGNHNGNTYMTFVLVLCCVCKLNA
jgi:hypothetical protein